MKSLSRYQSRGRKPADTGNQQGHRACARCSDGRAFSLVEMMIAIVILGLGLLMVATMFPVAWDRARTLSEHTIHQSVAAAAEATVQSVVRASSVKMVPISPIPANPPYEDARIASGGWAGDLIYDRQLARGLWAIGPTKPEAYRGIVLYSDTRVHALNLPNIRVPDSSVIAEDPWRLEYPDPTPDRFDIRGVNCAGNHPFFGSAYPVLITNDFCLRASFYQPQVDFAQRLYPPHEPRPVSTAADLDRWNERLSTRRFCWAVLHRLHEPIGPPCESQVAPGCFMAQINLGILCPPSPVAPLLSPDVEKSQCLVQLAEQSIGSTRNLDTYLVTLRKPQPTHRYARQNPAPHLVPNPFDLEAGAVSVEALNVDEDGVPQPDVALPVAWRVQVELPQDPSALKLRSEATVAPALQRPEWLPTGIPTEITVPATGVTGHSVALVISMFPNGTTFIDEITGNVYRAVKRRIQLQADGTPLKAVLTLDREIVLEDIDLPAFDSRCGSCFPLDPLNPFADLAELTRTVWVFPPPVDRSSNNPIFEGPSPVVSVAVRTISVLPPG